jgi:purine-binding chemotaxis protein CheW
MTKSSKNPSGNNAVAIDYLEVELAKEEVTESRQFVTFFVGNEVFAVDMAPVQEIIRVPEVVRVPLAPDALDGLTNLRGKVLPIISLRRMFGFEELTHDDSTRAVVIDIGQPLGFVVDRVASVVGVDQSQIEGVDDIRSTVNADLLSGIIKKCGEHEMVMVLDFEKLILREFTKIAEIAKSAGATTNSLVTERSEISDELQLVSFVVDQQEYAINIEDVQEIVQVPSAIIQVPHSQSHALGIMTLRNRLLPIVCLRKMFGLTARPLDEASRIVVLSLEGSSVGVAVDGVSEVLRVAKAYVDSMPPLLARQGNLTDITEICRLDDGKRLVSVITARNLFDHSTVKEALSNMSEMNQDGIQDGNQDQVSVDESLGDDEQVVIFLLDKEEFGVPIDSVQEIVRVPEELTRVPNSPVFVEGVVNLRGSVLPVIDLRLRLGLNQAERSDRQRIMVFLLNGLRTGFIVDHVAEVLRIPKSAVELAPQFSSEQGAMLSRMANLEQQKRMVQLIEPAYLIESDMLAELASVVKK